MFVELKKRVETYEGIDIYSIGVVNGNEIPDGSRLECLVYVPEIEIDGHWLVRRTNRECARYIEPEHDVVLGVTSHSDRRNHKVYEIAKKEALEIARYCECEVREE